MQKVALPLHVQKLQGALNLDALINQVERAFNESLTVEKVVRHGCVSHTSDAPTEGVGPRVYNFTHVTEERQWVKVSV